MYVWPQYRENNNNKKSLQLCHPQKVKARQSHRLYAAATFAELAV